MVLATDARAPHRLAPFPGLRTRVHGFFNARFDAAQREKAGLKCGSRERLTDIGFRRCPPFSASSSSAQLFEALEPFTKMRALAAHGIDAHVFCGLSSIQNLPIGATEP